MSGSAGVWLAAFLTLGILSFLYKDNPVYRACESVFVGVSAAYWLVVLFWQVVYPKILINLRDAAAATVTRGAWDDRWLYLIAAVLGIMMLMRLLPKGGWISRWPLAFIVGSTAGLYLITYLQSNAIQQMQNTMVPLVTAGRGAVLGVPLPFRIDWNALFIFAGTFTGLVYFFFSVEHRRTAGALARIGIFFLMVTFGASFGYTVMSRMSLLIGRMDFLLADWLGVLK